LRFQSGNKRKIEEVKGQIKRAKRTAITPQNEAEKESVHQEDDQERWSNALPMPQLSGASEDQMNALNAWYWAGYYTGRLSVIQERNPI
jgi:hypothetical protein